MEGFENILKNLSPMLENLSKVAEQAGSAATQAQPVEKKVLHIEGTECIASRMASGVITLEVTGGKLTAQELFIALHARFT